MGLAIEEKPQMTYRIEGLRYDQFQPLFDLTDEQLAAQGARRVTADSPTGYPCRVSLEDAGPGEELVLLNYVSHDVDGPFRTTYGIFVRKNAAGSARYTDETPEYLGDTDPRPARASTPTAC
jgi:hypothetical protein